MSDVIHRGKNDSLIPARDCIVVDQCEYPGDAPTGGYFWHKRRGQWCRRCTDRFNEHAGKGETQPSHCLCGEPIEAPRGGGIRKWCSLNCEKRDGRGWWCSDELRYRIYERDGWICQICGEDCSPTLIHHDPLAPTLDHILPRKHGGLDTPENLRLAHFGCNSARGAPDVLV